MRKRIILLFLILQISLLNFSLSYAEGPEHYLKGKFYNSVKDHFLIATEKMSDSRFEKTVITILENDEYGAWGLVVNKSLGYLPLASLIDSSINVSEENKKLYKEKIPIFWGGPVDTEKIFILHSSEYESESTILFNKVSVSQDYNALFDIAKKKGPKKSLIILGYSGWGSGQLEGEMERDHWILSDIDLNIVFDKNSDTKWNEAFKNSFIKI